MAGSGETIQVAEINRRLGELHAKIFDVSEAAAAAGCEIGHDTAAYIHDLLTTFRCELTGAEVCGKLAAYPDFRPYRTKQTDVA